MGTPYRDGGHEPERWEHKLLRLTMRGFGELRVDDEVEAELAALGREGWAVVAAFDAAGPWLVLRRALVEPFAPRPLAPPPEEPLHEQPELAATLPTREAGNERLASLAKEARARRKRERGG
jgi:hypothetical protein